LEACHATGSHIADPYQRGWHLKSTSFAAVFLRRCSKYPPQRVIATTTMADMEKDLEKHTAPESPPLYATTTTEVGSIEAVKARDLQNKNVVFRKLRQGEEWLDQKMGIESTGIDRIPDEDKEPPSIWNVRISPTLHYEKQR
jgi:hypothetical protein